MKLNYKRTLLVGLAFLSIMSFWQMYDSIVPKILTKTFAMNETLSGAIMAVMALWYGVGHWNSWFDGMIYMKSPDKYPLQTYLRNVINAVDMASIDIHTAASMAEISSRTLTAAQIFIAILPILIVYPLLQKYFIAGMTLGSVKE